MLACSLWNDRFRPIADVERTGYEDGMAARLFTFVCEFKGTTAISQVIANDELEAVSVWA